MCNGDVHYIEVVEGPYEVRAGAHAQLAATRKAVGDVHSGATSSAAHVHYYVPSEVIYAIGEGGEGRWFAQAELGGAKVAEARRGTAQAEVGTVVVGVLTIGQAAQALLGFAPIVDARRSRAFGGGHGAFVAHLVDHDVTACGQPDAIGRAVLHQVGGNAVLEIAVGHAAAGATDHEVVPGRKRHIGQVEGDVYGTTGAVHQFNLQPEQWSGGSTIVLQLHELQRIGAGLVVVHFVDHQLRQVVVQDGVRVRGISGVGGAGGYVEVQHHRLIAFVIHVGGGDQQYVLRVGVCIGRHVGEHHIAEGGVIGAVGGRTAQVVADRNGDVRGWCNVHAYADRTCSTFRSATRAEFEADHGIGRGSARHLHADIVER